MCKIGQAVSKLFCIFFFFFAVSFQTHLASTSRSQAVAMSLSPRHLFLQEWHMDDNVYPPHILPLTTHLTSCLCSPDTQTASKVHLHIWYCLHTHTHTESTQTMALILGLCAGITGRPSIPHLPSEASNITFSPLAQLIAAPDLWSALQSVNDCGPGSAVTWIGCWWLIKWYISIWKGSC